ncbi:hypothetical protein PVAP13_2KG463105 [Panicum virgatum]|uniref:Uncharacterized protein n=1 Tax=Panicum virgatum TaxID=38727 RepID=A0A8T0WMK9_PANVG|nr:hypothetical protein PVAP13_2KG463105 [Panicum virgatum]
MNLPGHSSGSRMKRGLGRRESGSLWTTLTLLRAWRRAQEVAGGDRPRHAPLQPPHARRSKMPTSRLRAMPLDAAASTPRCSTPPGRCFRAAAAFAPPFLHAAAASTPRRSTPPQPPRPHATSTRRLRVPLFDAAATSTPSQPPRPHCSMPLQLPSLVNHLRAMRLHVATVAAPHSTPPLQPAAAALQTLMGAVSIWIEMRWAGEEARGHSCDGSSRHGDGYSPQVPRRTTSREIDLQRPPSWRRQSSWAPSFRWRRLQSLGRCNLISGGSAGDRRYGTRAMSLDLVDCNITGLSYDFLELLQRDGEAASRTRSDGS